MYTFTEPRHIPKPIIRDDNGENGQVPGNGKITVSLKVPFWETFVV